MHYFFSLITAMRDYHRPLARSNRSDILLLHAVHHNLSYETPLFFTLFCHAFQYPISEYLPSYVIAVYNVACRITEY